MKSLGKALVGLLVMVVILAAAAEFGLRWYIGNQLETSVKAQSPVAVQENPSIKFGATPLLFSLVTKTVPNVDVSVPSTLQISSGADAPVISGAPAADVSLTDLDISDPQVLRAAHMVAHVELPDEFLLATIQRQMADNPPSTGSTIGDALAQRFLHISGVTSRAATQAVDIEFADGIATLTLEPRAADGNLSFTATNAELLGFEVPQEIVDAISESLASAAQDAAGQMSVDKLEVKDGLIDLTVSSDNPSVATQQ